jgi:hypothetical protein
MSVPLALRISGSMLVPLRYFIRWTSFLQSSLSGAHTLIIKNAIAMHVSGVACLVVYSLLATTRLWNSTAFSGQSFSWSLSTLKRSSGAALDFVPPPLGSALSKALMI